MGNKICPCSKESSLEDRKAGMILKDPSMILTKKE
jgi:hypothetical protein